MRIGYFLSSEEYTPAQMIEQARGAERAGFTGLWKCCGSVVVSHGSLGGFAPAEQQAGNKTNEKISQQTDAGLLVIGGIGAVSVYKAVYIDRRELKCACVGGNSNVPLGFVSLTENLMMVGMAVWMVLWAM